MDPEGARKIHRVFFSSMPQQKTPGLSFSYFINCHLLSPTAGQWVVEVPVVAKGAFKFAMHARAARIATRRQEDQEEEQQQQEQEQED